MAPEQAAGRKDLTVAADVYSLGVILYERLTGQTPFAGDNALTLLRQARESEPPRPSSIRPGIDRDLETIVLKCLEKEPGRRYLSTGSLSDDLDRWLAGEPIAARPVSRWQRVRKWVRRKPAIAALSAAVFLIGLLGLAGVLWQWHAAIEALGIARKIAYAAHINLAQREWDNNNVVRARELLEDADEAEFRGFEWHYLKRLYYPERLTLKPSEDRLTSVTSVAFSPDGKRLATASSGRKWTSPDGKQVVWPGGATVQLWDAATGKVLLTIDGIPASISGGEFITTRGFDGRPTPRRFATRAEYDAAKHNIRDLLSTGGGSYFGNQTAGVAFSPDGQYLAAGSGDATVKVWDATTGKARLVLKGHTKDVTAVAFSPDGQWLASASEDQTFKLWDLASDRELHILKGQPRAVHGMAFSPDGQRLASASGATVKLWDAASGHERLTIKAHAGDVRSVAFSPDGRRIASAGDDAMVRLWDAASGRKLLEWHTGRVSHLTFSPDGQRLAAGGDGNTVRLWDAASGHDLFTFKGHTGGVQSVAFSPDGTRLASADFQTVKLWDTAGDEARLTLKEHAHNVSSFGGGDVRRVAFSPDGQRLAAAGRGTTVTVWNALTGREHAHAPGPQSGRHGCGVQPRWPAPGLGQRGSDDQALGPQERPGAPHTQRAQQLRQVRGVQPRRPAACLGRRRQLSESLGHRQRQRTAHITRADGHPPRHLPRQRQRRQRRGVQPRRPAPCSDDWREPLAL